MLNLVSGELVPTESNDEDRNPSKYTMLNSEKTKKDLLHAGEIPCTYRKCKENEEILLF